MNVKFLGIFLLSLGLLFSCSDEVKEISEEIKLAERVIDPVQYSRGARLYQLNCAACHGKNGEGAKNWRRPDENGKNQPPPLNGTGHTWHHSNQSLTNTIKNGTAKLGGNMPAWKGKLSNSEIKLILIWIKAQWPDGLYTAWYNRFHQKQ